MRDLTFGAWITRSTARALAACERFLASARNDERARDALDLPILAAASARSDLHDLRFFVLEMVVDRFDETIGQFLNLGFQIVQLVFAQPAGSF